MPEETLGLRHLVGKNPVLFKGHAYKYFVTLTVLTDVNLRDPDPLPVEQTAEVLQRLVDSIGATSQGESVEEPTWVLGLSVKYIHEPCPHCGHERIDFNPPDEGVS